VERIDGTKTFEMAFLFSRGNLALWMLEKPLLGDAVPAGAFAGVFSRAVGGVPLTDNECEIVTYQTNLDRTERRFKRMYVLLNIQPHLVRWHWPIFEPAFVTVVGVVVLAVSHRGSLIWPMKALALGTDSNRGETTASDPYAGYFDFTRCQDAIAACGGTFETLELHVGHC